MEPNRKTPAHTFVVGIRGDVVNAAYLLACGIVWKKRGDEDAGQELVVALACPDPELRYIAQRLLVSAGPISLPLLEYSISAGTLAPTDASSCMLELLAEKARSSYSIYHPEAAHADCAN